MSRPMTNETEHLRVEKKNPNEKYLRQRSQGHTSKSFALQQ